MPPPVHIRQRFTAERLADVARVLIDELTHCGVTPRRGARIAIAVGSRGIANLPVLVRQVVAWVHSHGAQPFIVPAMGSHGGATDTGQAAVLAGYGITEALVGAPVYSSLEVVPLPSDQCPTPVYLDRYAAEADGIILINRVKPHTSFHGRYESGLMKMLAIGLGKHQQALAIHALGVRGLREVMPQVARQVLRYSNVLLGVAVVENAYDETMLLRAIPAAEIPEQEPALLERARAAMPALPVAEVDVLIVDEAGKNISGLGMDPHTIGRLKIPGETEPARPAIRMIYLRDLTDASHGNATGMGLADLVSRSFFAKIDFLATYENVITTGFLERGKVPVIVDSDTRALEIALRAARVSTPEAARIVRITNTLRLDDMLVSPVVLAEVSGCNHIEVVGEAAHWFV